MKGAERQMDAFDHPVHDLRSDTARFAGYDYVPWRDSPRLTGQIKRVYDVCLDGKKRTLREIQEEIEARFDKRDPEASISAQLRHLRKKRFGSHLVEKAHRGDPANGLYEYWLVVPSDSK